jgi:hypothetical protein
MPIVSGFIPSLEEEVKIPAEDLRDPSLADEKLSKPGDDPSVRSRDALAGKKEKPFDAELRRVVRKVHGDPQSAGRHGLLCGLAVDMGKVEKPRASALDSSGSAME